MDRKYELEKLNFFKGKQVRTLIEYKADNHFYDMTTWMKFIVEERSEPSAIVSDDGIIEKVNTAYVDFSGYSHREIEGKMHFMHIVDPEDQIMVLLNHENGSDISKYARVYSFRFVNKQGVSERIETNVKKIGNLPYRFVFINRIEEKSFDTNIIETPVCNIGQSCASTDQLMGIIKLLSRFMEIKDPYTYGHQERVANLAVAMARDLGYSELDQKLVEMAALIHDVGKSTIPSEILNKSGALSAAEYNLIKGHSLAGGELLKSFTLTYEIGLLIEQHHEKLDGSGYPYGLHGDEIHNLSKIICVADVYDAMTSHRPYRPALSNEIAEMELKSNAGRLYDEAVVEACLKIAKRDAVNA